MSETWDTLKAEVAQSKSVMASAVTFIRGLKQRLEEIVDAPTTEQVQELIDSLHAGEQDLAAAMVQNTLASNETPV